MDDKEPGAPKLTIPVRWTLEALLRAHEHGRETYGGEIADTTDLPRGTVHPILVRFGEAGWTSSRWEDGDPHEKKRRLRKYYKLTGAGLEKARSLRKTENTEEVQ